MWEIYVHAEGENELKQIKKNSPELFNQICSVMDELSQFFDPRTDRNVEHLFYDAPGWYRYKIRNPIQVRIIFRLLNKINGEFIEVHVNDTINPNGKQVIQIMGCNYRSCVYNNLKIKWLRVKRASV